MFFSNFSSRCKVLHQSASCCWSDRWQPCPTHHQQFIEIEQVHGFRVDQRQSLLSNPTRSSTGLEKLAARFTDKVSQETDADNG